MDLPEMMSNAGGAYLRILVQSDGDGCARGGMVLMSLPSGITLRMKTALSMVFPFTVIGNAGMDENKLTGQAIPADNIMDGLTGLQQALMQYGVKAKPDSDEAHERDSIFDLDFSPRTYNCLRKAGVDTVGQLRAMSDEELMKLQKIGGQKSLNEIREKLSEF